MLENILQLLTEAIQEDPPMTIQEGGLIKEGYNKEIDELRGIKHSAKEWIVQYQKAQQEETGIATLKIKFNNVFGYFIEVTKAHAHKVPESYTRKQTMVNAERYITPELKEYEEKVLNADQKLQELEYQCFQEIREKVLEGMDELYTVSESVATLDVLTTFSEIAYAEKYCKPEIQSTKDLYIERGRHPVVESLELPNQEQFVPNDTRFVANKEELLLLTGPNMAGKSTYIRQTALICLLAQIGSFVPAERAQLPLIDKIFTRVGASDNVSRGQSTFMVEMQETAYILNNATEHSLIILDEIGRGTSTYDGLSLAWAIAEYVHNTIKAKTLFATHYHELIELTERLKRGKNYSVAVSETSTGVVFLRKIVEGGASESYGIEVAKLAGLPRDVIIKATKTLNELEKQEKHKQHLLRKSVDKNQLALFSQDDLEEKKIVEVQVQHPIIEEIAQLDINTMSPLEILNWVSKKKQEL